LIKAQKADTFGNLYFNKTARNFNADMATAAHCVIAEVEEIVEPGQIDPELVHVAAVYVDRIFKSNPNCPWSEKRV
jgi:3-oxoacid CoA-transferase subunit A